MRLWASLMFVAAALFAATTASATTFIVPTDEEMVERADAILVATVEGSYVQERDNFLETVHELRVKRTIKGVARAGELVRVITLGGELEDRAVIAHGEARFELGDPVLVFLTDDNGRWRATDMTLGKFRFVTSTRGEKLLVREMEDVVGWDHAGREHHEKVRREEGFLRFIEERVKGRQAPRDYEVDSSEVTLSPAPSARFEAAATGSYPPATYTSWVSNLPTRFSNIAAGVNFWKRSDQNISGAADGGVSAIQSGLAAWTNESGSVINLIYAGQRATPSTDFDNICMVEYNDPQGRISGSWTGSGTIGITFSSYNNQHQFDNRTWWSIGDADVVFQNGFPATHAAFAAAMTHELGHAIGWRHSNQNHLTDGACDPSVEECTSAAIMNSSVSAGYGYTLQPWDINAARAVYPGSGTPCTPPSITSQPASTTITSGSSTTLSVTATGTTLLSYQWYRGTSGSTSNPVSGGTSRTLTVNPTSTTSYWVRVTNSCGTANSATATVTVTAAPPPPPPPQPGAATKKDFNGDGRSDVLWFNASTGEVQIWFMSGASRTAAIPGSAPLGWTPVAIGDFNEDGLADIFWRSNAGENSVWLMNGSTILSRTLMPAVTDLSWRVQGAGDFDGNGTADIMWRNISTGHNTVWFMNGTSRTIGSLTTVDTDWDPSVLGDFNGDGRSDIFWRSEATGATAIWLMNGATATNFPMPAVTDLNWVPEGGGDFNGDGRSDVFWRNASNGQNSIWLMNGASRTIVMMPVVGGTWQPRFFGEFDGDGTWDIFWRDSAGNTAVWLLDNATVTTNAGMPAMSTAWQPVSSK